MALVNHIVAVLPLSTINNLHSSLVVRVNDTVDGMNSMGPNAYASCVCTNSVWNSFFFCLRATADSYAYLFICKRTFT